MNPETTHARPRSYRSLVKVLCLLILAALIFEAGTLVGYRRAAFSYHWNEMYFRGPGDPRSFFVPFAGGDTNPNPNGAAGQIVSVNLPEIMVRGPGSTAPEKIVIISPDTMIRRVRGEGTSSDLVSGTYIIAIGKPDDNGEIRASFVRIVPATSSAMFYSTTTPPSSNLK